MKGLKTRSVSMVIGLLAALALPAYLLAQVPDHLVDVPQSQMVAAASAQQGVNSPERAIDGNSATFWENRETGEHWIQVDLGYARTLGAFTVYGSDTRAQIKDYRLHVSNDPDPLEWGAAVQEGELPQTTDTILVTFPMALGRYLTLVGESRHDWGRTYINDLNVYESAFFMADKQTERRDFTNSNLVDVAGFPVMPGYNEYQITDSAVAPGDGWLAYDPDNPPTGLEVDLNSPGEGDTVTRHAWFQDSTTANPITNATASITFIRDTADVTALAIEAITLPSWGADYPAVVRMRQVDTNSSSSIGIFSRTLTVSPGPDTLPGDPERLEVETVGSHTITLTVMDMAGNIDTAEITLTVTEGNVDQVTDWTGSGDGWDWFDNDNWSDDLPGPGSTVTVGAGADILLVEPTAGMTVFNMTGGKLTFAGWNDRLTASQASIKGTVTHLAQAATEPDEFGDWIPDSRVYIACDTLTVESDGGKIQVNERGFQGGPTYTTGYGPGGGDSDRGGGGYGGRGGQGFARLVLGLPYGSAEAPLLPGSGGGGSGGVGADGGGAVRIEATGKVTVSGTIEANGGNSSGVRGGGSGGAIYITCGTFDGTGTLSAAGGTSWGATHGGGGGGRIAVHYTDTVAQALLNPTVDFHLGGRRGDAMNRQPGGMGSLYLSDHSFFPIPDMTGGGQLHIPGFTEWHVSHLSIHGSGVQFPPYFSLTVDNNLSVTNRGELVFTDSIVNIGGDVVVQHNTPTLTLQGNSRFECNGDFMIADNGHLLTFAGFTNAVWNPAALEVKVGGGLSVAANCSIQPHTYPTNLLAGPVRFRVRNLNLAADAEIDADNRGFAAATVAGGWGYGPGGGQTTYGASHAGLGGPGCWGGDYGAIYGVSNAPVRAGSGGGRHSAGTNPGGPGGGQVWIDVEETALVDGTINANGGNAGGAEQGGGGSGGSIYLTCRDLEGSGDFLANGGNSGTGSNHGGGGSGGRIAIWSMFRDDFNGDAVANGGNAYEGRLGATGTVVWGQIMPDRGTIIMIR